MLFSVGKQKERNRHRDRKMCFIFPEEVTDSSKEFDCKHNSLEPT